MEVLVVSPRVPAFAVVEADEALVLVAVLASSDPVVELPAVVSLPSIVVAVPLEDPMAAAVVDED